jgi:hypothetical protein
MFPERTTSETAAAAAAAAVSIQWEISRAI